jgi:hypothetical protein
MDGAWLPASISAFGAIVISLGAWYQWATKRKDGLADKAGDIHDQIRRSNYWYMEHFHKMRRLCIDNGIDISHIPVEPGEHIIKGTPRKEVEE